MKNPVIKQNVRSLNGEPPMVDVTGITTGLKRLRKQFPILSPWSRRAPKVKQ